MRPSQKLGMFESRKKNINLSPEVLDMSVLIVDETLIDATRDLDSTRFLISELYLH